MIKIFKKLEIRELIDILKKTSEIVPHDSPSIIRDVLRVIIYIFTLIFILILIPIFIPIVLLVKKKPDPFNELYKDLKLEWYTESSLSSLKRLRYIYKYLTREYDKLRKMRTVEINPYGKFRWSEYIQVTETLYMWEIQFKNFNEAKMICDNLLEKLIKQKSHISKNTEEWIVYKAKVLKQLEGNISAEKYLMEYLDPNKKESPIKEYLYVLRKEK